MILIYIFKLLIIIKLQNKLNLKKKYRMQSMHPKKTLARLRS